MAPHTKPLLRLQLPSIADKDCDSNMASRRNEFNMATANDSGTDVPEYTPPGSDDHTSPKTEPCQPIKDTKPDIGIDEVRQLFGVGDTHPFVKVSRELASNYALGLQQTLHSIENLGRDPLLKCYRVILHRHWTHICAVLLEVNENHVVPLTYANACAIDNRATQPSHPGPIPPKLKRSTIKMLDKSAGPLTLEDPRLIDGGHQNHPLSSIHRQEKALDRMPILTKPEVQNLHASTNHAAQTAAQVKSELNKPEWNTVKPEWNKPKWNTAKIEQVARPVNVRSHNIPLGTAHSWLDAHTKVKQHQSKWNTVKVHKPARVADLRSLNIPIGTARSWIDGAMEGNSPKLSTLEQVRSQMTDQVVDDGCTACANWGCDHCKPDWYDSLLQEPDKQDEPDCSTCNAGWRCAEYDAVNEQLEHRVESKQIDKPAEANKLDENGESELCDGSWGGCGECSNCKDGAEGAVDEETYDGSQVNAVLGAAHTNIDDETAAGGAATISKAAQTGNTHCSCPASILPILENIRQVHKASVKAPEAWGSHADMSAVGDQAANDMPFTDGTFSAADVDDILMICRIQLDKVEALCTDSCVDEVRQIMKTWLPTTGGDSAPISFARSDDEESAEKDHEVRARDEDDISKKDDCRGCSEDDCNTCCPEQDSEEVVMEFRHCGYVFPASLVERCPVCNEASGLHTYRESDKEKETESKHSGRLYPSIERSPVGYWGPPLGHEVICEPEASSWSTVPNQVDRGNDEGNDSYKPPTWEWDQANKSCRGNTDDGWGASSNQEDDLDDISARGHSRVDGANDGAGIASKNAAPVPEPYTVTFWATVECGEDSMDILINSNNVTGPEKLILDGPAKKVWKLVQEKGLGDTISVQDAYNLAKDILQVDEPKIKPVTTGTGPYERAPRHYTQPHGSRQSSVRSESASLWGGGDVVDTGDIDLGHW